MDAKTHGSVRGEKQVTEEKHVSIYGEYSHSVGTSFFMCLCVSALEGDIQAHMYTAMYKPEINYSGQSPIRTWESSVALDGLSSEPQGSYSVCLLSTQHRKYKCMALAQLSIWAGLGIKLTPSFARLDFTEPSYLP